MDDRRDEKKVTKKGEEKGTKRKEEGLGEGKRERGQKKLQKRKKEVTEGERKITRETEVRQNISDTDRRGSEEEEKKEKTAFLSQPGGECQLCLSDL